MAKRIVAVVLCTLLVFLVAYSYFCPQYNFTGLIPEGEPNSQVSLDHVLQENLCELAPNGQVTVYTDPEEKETSPNIVLRLNPNEAGYLAVKTAGFIPVAEMQISFEIEGDPTPIYIENALMFNDQTPFCVKIPQEEFDFVRLSFSTDIMLEDISVYSSCTEGVIPVGVSAI